ncbi:MAG: CotH kinase family protein [Planctomycetota bacterium]
MQVASDSPKEHTGFALALLAVGVAIGLAWPRSTPAPEDGWNRGPGSIEPRLIAGAATDAVVTALPELAIRLDDGAARRLTASRERALERGLIVQQDDDLVPATIAFAGGAELPADVRIKGDWVDHVAGERWSLRVELDKERLLGMRVFSIQDPKTRGFLWEWLVHRAMQRVGILAPRGTFCDVSLNGNPWGVYYLEEHFSKELLESQGRREGPIVLWDESAMWNAQLQAHHLPPMGVAMDVPASLARTPTSGVLSAEEAFPRAYGEKRLRSVDGLARGLDAALDKLRALSAAVLVEQNTSSRLRRLEALALAEAHAVESLVDIEALAKHHAVASLFQLEHPLAWHNMRFYFDPVRARLEPISFDNMAHEPGGRDPVPLRATDVAALFGASERYVAAVHRHLGAIANPDWIAALFADTREELLRFEQALDQQAPLAAPLRLGAMQERIFRQAGWLQSVLDPIDPLQTDARYTLEPAGGAQEAVTGRAWVDAWASTRTPIVVEAVRFSNGTELSAAALAPAHLVREGRGVLLPVDGRRVRFAFELDRRLANLSNVEALLSAFEPGALASGDPDLALSLVWRPAAKRKTRTEALRMRPSDPRWDAEGDRPTPPTVAEALERHPFLRYAVDAHEFRALQGTWDVAGDLVLPAGAKLELVAGTTLRFETDALLLAGGALRFRGTEAAPVVLEPAAGADRFRGILVLDAADRSEWTHTIVRQTDALQRGGWISTGGVTFYHSDVTLLDSRFEETFAEDGLNLFGGDIELVRCVFAGCRSDSLDGDFVTGRIVACEFLDGLADGADFSGSNVEVRGCIFRDLADKAVSVGEDSTVRVVGGRATRVAIGIASKDRSKTVVTDFEIRDASLFGLAAFVKKAAFGPSELYAERVTITGTDIPALAQTGCRVVIDGVVVPERAVDVDALYEGTGW